MSGPYQVYEPPAIPTRLDETSQKGTQRAGQLSASPLLFQRGLWKVPEGARQLANHEPSFWTSTSTSPYPALTSEQVVSSVFYTPRVRERLAAEDTQALRASTTQAQRKQQQAARWLRHICAVLGYTTGAGIVVTLYILVPVIHLSSSVGLSRWQYLVAILGMLGLGELSFAAIVRKTITPHYHQ